jgi:hypothetical protein
MQFSAICSFSQGINWGGLPISGAGRFPHRKISIGSDTERLFPGSILFVYIPPGYYPEWKPVVIKLL